MGSIKIESADGMGDGRFRHLRLPGRGRRRARRRRVRGPLRADGHGRGGIPLPQQNHSPLPPGLPGKYFPPIYSVLMVKLAS